MLDSEPCSLCEDGGLAAAAGIGDTSCTVARSVVRGRGELVTVSVFLAPCGSSVGIDVVESDRRMPVRGRPDLLGVEREDSRSGRRLLAISSSVESPGDGSGITPGTKAWGYGASSSESGRWTSVEMPLSRERASTDATVGPAELRCELRCELRFSVLGRPFSALWTMPNS